MDEDKVDAALFTISARLDSLLHCAMPKCPSCTSEQVQLVNYLSPPAQWKCRKCKTRFAFEPKGKN